MAGISHHRRWMRRERAFTLVELLVAMALMALLLTMIATVFQRATGAFSMARATVEIHQNARAAFDQMIRDFAAASLCEYENKAGYFAIGWVPDPEQRRAVQSVTFTTYADQPGARPLIPGVSPQLTLVRYTLRSRGAPLTIRGDNPETTALEDEYEVQTYDLIKQVRFPQIAYYYTDMDEFDGRYVTDEVVTTDVLAMNVLEMRTRILYRGHYVEVLDHGRAKDAHDDADALHADDSSVDDDTREWPDAGDSVPDPADLPANAYLLLLGGQGAPQIEREISSNTNRKINITGSFLPSPIGGRPTYRIEQTTGALVLHPMTSDVTSDQPQWLRPPVRDAEIQSGKTKTYADANMFPMIVIERMKQSPVGHDPIPEGDVRMPYVVEVTLEMTDGRGRRFHSFTERFFIPSSVLEE